MQIRGQGWSGRASPRLLALERLAFGPALLLVVIAGMALRLASLVQPVGYDEDFTTIVAHQPVDQLLAAVARDSSPPLFYLLERAMVVVAAALGIGPSGMAGAAVLRIVPMAAGLALVPLVALLARRLAGDAPGLMAGAIVALAPAQVQLSGFARMYGLAAAFTVAATILLWRAVETPRRPGRGEVLAWLGYLATATAAAWSSYFAALGLAGALAAALWLRPRPPKALLAVGVTTAAVLSVVPWLAATQLLAHAGVAFWVGPLSPLLVLSTAAQLFSGPPVDARLPGAATILWLQVLAGIGGGLALWSALLTARRGPAPIRRGTAFCLMASGGVIVLVAVSVWRPLLDERYATVMWMPLFAVAGVGLAALQPRLAAVILGLLAAASIGVGVIPSRAATADLVPALDDQVADPDIVVTSWDRYLVLLDQSGPEVRQRLRVLSVEPLPWYVGTAAYPAGAEIRAIAADIARTGGRIFWVADPSVAPASLPAGYIPVRSECVRLVCLTIYGLPPAPGRRAITA